LRKQAKVRLAMMKAKVPSARLADAQQVLAREYGFVNWAALQAEVTQRTGGPAGRRAWVHRAHVAPLYPERFRQDGLIDQEADVETTAAFFRAGVAAQIGFCSPPWSVCRCCSSPRNSSVPLIRYCNGSRCWRTPSFRRLR
jgi:hypothetical protein